ncbi:MAG: type IV secretion protein Rhs, partial [Sphingobacteriales bacterium]
MKKIFLFLIILPLYLFGQSGDQNYIKTSDYKKASTTTTINPATDLTINITYFDGLGRPIQKIAVAQSGTGTDIITPIVYDIFGRQVSDYLPYASSGTTMQYVDNSTLVGSIGTFYTNKFGTAEGQYPFAEKRLEYSPIGRTLEQGAPGTVWVVLPTSDTDHTMKFGYELNSGTGVERVKLFRATAAWNTTNEVYTETLVNAAGTTYYPANQLYKNVTKDENWVSGKDGTTEDYKNQEGQLLLKRKFESGTALDTYYVYDQFGNLAFVLPPMATGSIS